MRGRSMKLDSIVFKCAVVAPVTEQHGRKGDIEVGCAGSVESNGSSESIGVLE